MAKYSTLIQKTCVIQISSEPIIHELRWNITLGAAPVAAGLWAQSVFVLLLAPARKLRYFDPKQNQAILLILEKLQLVMVKITLMRVMAFNQ